MRLLFLVVCELPLRSLSFFVSSLSSFDRLMDNLHPVFSRMPGFGLRIVIEMKEANRAGAEKDRRLAG